MEMCHTFFIHSSIEGYLIFFFQILVIINNGAMIIVEQIKCLCSMIEHLLGIWPRVVFVDSEVG